MTSKISKCKSCRFKAEDKLSLKLHQSIKHTPEQICNQCGVFRFRINSNYLAHIRQCRGRVLLTKKVEKGIKNKNIILKKSENTKEELTEQKTVEATDTKNLFKCSKCDYKSTQNEDMKQHVSSNHQMYECGKCGFATDILSESALNYHTSNCKVLKKRMFAYF